MRLYHSCGAVLTIKHTISLTLASNFDIDGEEIFLTKHRLLESKSTNPRLLLKGCKEFFCNKCQESISYAETRTSCDDCGNLFEQKELKDIGGILFCRRCLGKNKNFSDFVIFGERSKTKKQRDRILAEAYDSLTRDVVARDTSIPPLPASTPPVTSQFIVNNIWGNTSTVTIDTTNNEVTLRR